MTVKQALSTRFMNTKYLLIDRMLSKQQHIENAKTIGEVYKDAIRKSRPITELEINKIDQLTGDITREDLFSLVSIGTPMEDFTPVKFNMIFDFENLERTEDAELTVEHVVWLRKHYLLQLPHSHHCHIFVRSAAGTPRLFETLPIDSYDKIRIGICNKIDWPEIKLQTIESRKRNEEYRRANPLPNKKE
jgi:hypothetical protein